MRSSGPALDASIPLVTQLRGLVSQDELRGFAADLRPTVPALAAPVPREHRRCPTQNRLLASCQNEVVLPWSKDKVGDKQFPADGPGLQRGAEGVPGPRRREPLG